VNSIFFLGSFFWDFVVALAGSNLVNGCSRRYGRN
jgi:hypothetical protein